MVVEGGKPKARATERLGRVAKVAAEQSFLRCGPQPPTQRDSVYRAIGPFVDSIPFGQLQLWVRKGCYLRTSALTQNKWRSS